MPETGEWAYVYAKACGIIGKSFIGKNRSRLGGLTRLSELDRLVFGTDAQDLPGRDLLVNLERRTIDRTAKQILGIVDAFMNPPELLVRLVRDFEYMNLKQVINAVAAGERTLPAVTPIGRFSTIQYQEYPHFPLMLKGTEFEFLLEDLLSPVNVKPMVIQNKLDHHYYTGLWKSLLALSPRDRKSIERILMEELSLRNSIWALRMRTYYHMSEEETREYMVFISTLADDAVGSLSMALDNPSDWARWRWAKFLNPYRPGEIWSADPRYFQNAAAEYLYHMTWCAFRFRPFSLGMAACFIKLKIFEEDLLISVAEGLSLGMGSQEILSLLKAAS